MVAYAMNEPVPEEHTDAELLVTWASPPKSSRTRPGG